mmetsp:Transcript_21619/g.54417  ORF Transcript_21619/g.54417 Transcript_21619/m.54417 type:complete len:121 (-) Transcript_21619:264-626(-)|eukprot:jgi/Tetstr1/437589/TSEL_026260.t1
MGVQVEVLEPGSSDRKPQHTDIVHCHYTGRLEDGTVFDSSVERGKPLTFLIGIGAVIRGWDEGIAQMTLGSKARLTCTPDYGYGDEGSPPKIPPGAVLIFDVELLQIGDDKPAKPGCALQ